MQAVLPRTGLQISPSPQQDATWHSRTVQLVAGHPAPGYASDDLLPSFPLTRHGFPCLHLLT